jgi:hypothetical protein
MDARTRRPRVPPAWWRTPRRLVVAAALLAALAAGGGPAGALEGAAVGLLTVEAGDPRVVEIRRGGAALPVGGAPFALHAQDRVVLRDPAARVRLDLPWRRVPLVLQGAGLGFVVPPPPEAATPAAWQATYERFWQAIAPATAAAPSPPPRRTTRGVPLPGGPGGALRPLDGLPLDGARVPAGAGGGLALAWAGGLPPFEVQVAAASDGRVLARATAVQARQARFADLVIPAAPLLVTLRDAEGQSVVARLLPEPRPPSAFPAAAAAAAPVAYAIVLYEEAGPEWRLEALRRLLARAARDPLAATAARRILEGAP